ncbi:hypothetical protein BDV29DRAFT_174380 [Aspergillus leporis]|uniref:Uncharacterized protein n=1 Tax=Aspergillus leporis TaxID=41062 RepID=A0A5N5X231_9EURO|nr:hypothetical protein BDV29DRAFT_174380 [Aspergillus leporis]
MASLTKYPSCHSSGVTDPARVKTTTKASIHTTWSAQDDGILMDLRNCNVPWK